RMMTPLVAARCGGSAPSTLPKVRTWSRAKSHWEPCASAHSTASCSFAASRPTSPGALCCQEPDAGKYVARFAVPVCAATAAASAIKGKASHKRRLKHRIIMGGFLAGSVPYLQLCWVHVTQWRAPGFNTLEDHETQEGGCGTTPETTDR